MEEKVIALGSTHTAERGINLNHPFFDYIPIRGKKEIEAEIFMGKSYIVAFADKKLRVKAAAIFTVLDDTIHIREVGGEYVWAARWVNAYADQIACLLGRSRVSAVADNPIIKRRMPHYGFSPVEGFDNEFERVI